MRVPDVRAVASPALRDSVVLVAGLALAGVTQTAIADQVSLVADVGQKMVLQGEALTAAAMPRFAELAGALYFLHDDGVHGWELWRTDGTPGGTRLVRDICPGACGVEHYASVAAMTVMGDFVYFGANDGVHGNELWRSDGTAAGTMLVHDVRSGLASSLPTLLTPVGSTLYFWADDGVVGPELWKSDGTGPGTALVLDRVPGALGETAGAVAAVMGKLVFGFRSPTAELWASDGTPGGTEQIAAVDTWQQAFLGGAPFLALPGGPLLFWGDTAAEGAELWRSDGTAVGTSLLVDLEPGPDGSSPRNFALLGNELIFRATIGGPFASQPTLWRSDGTAAGTTQIPLPADVAPYGFRCTTTADRVFFYAHDLDHGAEPWVFDGASASMVKDVRPGPEGSGADLDAFWGFTLFATVGSRLVFTADDGIHGLELWTSDGTEPGTHLLAELAPGAEGVRLDILQLFAPLGILADFLHFRDYSRDFGRRLWRTDGTPAGTELVSVIHGQTSAAYPDAPGWSITGASPSSCFATAGGRLLFAADDGVFWMEPWTSDGTEVGTVLAANLAGGSYPWGWSSPLECRGVGGRGVFGASADDPPGSGLWSVDVTLGGAEQLLPGAAAMSIGRDGARLDGAYFLADSSAGLIRTDGTTAGTTQVTPGAGAGGYAELVTTGSNLVVTVGDSLESSDGVDATAVTFAGEAFTSASRLGRVGDAVLFAGAHPASQAELWRTDGTSDGTQPLADVRPGAELGVQQWLEGTPLRVATSADHYFFVADDGVHGAELWSSDGTPEGTAMVKDLGPGAYPSWPRELTAFDGKVFFVAEATGTGRELWVSDGTENGTVLVADIVPGEGSSLPQNLTVADGKLYFSAWDPLHGREAWRVLPAPAPPPGSVAEANVSGTAPPPPSIERLPNIALGTRSSSPLRFASVGGTVYTFANDNVRGFELWKIEEAGLIFRDGFESEDTEHWSGVEP